MSDGARRAKIPLLVSLLGGLALGAVLLLRSWPASGTAPQDSAAKPVTVDRATGEPLPATPPRVTPVVAASSVDAPPTAASHSPITRRGLTVEELLRDGPRDPITPPELRIDAEISPRGAMTAEPLVPPVVREDVEVAPRGAVTMEPLTPPVLELPPGTQDP